MADAASQKIELPLKPSVETLQQQIDSMKEAVRLLQEGVNRMPTPAIVDGKVGALKELTDTKISGLKELVDAKFEGNKTALDAALKTQKEASDKIEANFSKQFESSTIIAQATTKATDDKIGDLKDRITASESRGTGRGDVVGYIAIAVAIVAGLIGIFARFGN